MNSVNRRHVLLGLGGLTMTGVGLSLAPTAQASDGTMLFGLPLNAL